jgi:hypothetical protein
MEKLQSEERATAFLIHAMVKLAGDAKMEM